MRRPFVLLTALPLLAACASNAPVRTPDTALPAAYETQLPAGVARLDTWWTVYNDPQLQTLVDEALKSATDAKLALARLEEARATRLANIRSAYPTGALTANATSSGSRNLAGGQSLFQTPGVTTTETADFDVSWELDLWGKTRIANKGVDDDFLGKVFDIESTRASLAANVADSLFAARGLAQQLDDARESARIARDLQNVTQIQASHGLAPQSDADRAATQVSQADASIVDLQSQLDAARRSLLVLIGHGSDPLASLDIKPVSATPPLPPAEVPGELLERRPDLQEAEKRLEVATAQLKVDRLDLFPKFTILPGLGLTRTRSNSFIGFTPTGAPIIGPLTTLIGDWSLGAGLSVPVLDRPYLLATARAAGAQAEEAVITYEGAVQTAYGDAENALVELKSDQARLTLLDAAETSSRTAYDSTRKLYDAGLEDLTTLLSTEQTWRAAASQASAAHAQAMRRSVQAFKALGGGWTAGDDFTIKGGL